MQDELAILQKLFQTQFEVVQSMIEKYKVFSNDIDRDREVSIQILRKTLNELETTKSRVDSMQEGVSRSQEQARILAIYWQLLLLIVDSAKLLWT